MNALRLALALILAPLAAQAEDYRPVTEQAEFVSLVDGKTLSQRLFQVGLNVSANGEISGRALGGDVTGSWTWQDGFFCREMIWGGDLIPQDCQTVEVGGELLRFTAERGRGDSTALRIN